MSVETVSNSWRKKISTFRYFCQDSQRGPNLLSDSLLTTQNRSATRSASGRGHWPTPPTWIRLSLSQRICTRTILGSGFSSFCVVLLMNQDQHNLLCRYYLYSPDPFPSPSTRWRLPEPAAAPTRTQSSDYFTCWLLSGLNQQHLHFSNKKRSWEVFKLWKTKMVVRWRITWHDLDRSSVLLSRTRRRVSEDESWNIPP